MRKSFKFSEKHILLTIIALGAILRFYKLDWGEGYFFHPDEYHIVAAVNRLNFPTQMNPKLFSYGSFIVYLNYFTKTIFGNANPFLIGRFYSAFFSTLTIYLVYLISTKLFKERLPAFIAALLTATTPGLIQQAHFATPESTLIFWLTLTIYLWIKSLDTNKFKYLFSSAVTLGFALSTKIISTTFLPTLFLTPFILTKISKKNAVKALLKAVFINAALLLTTFATFAISFPYSILDWANFKRTTIYESGLGFGKQVVFYTRQFIDTKPFLFQTQKIFPYALGWILFITGSFGMIFIAVDIFKKVKGYKKLLVIFLPFVSYFTANTILFTKWVRFIAPTFPFFPIFAGYFVYNFPKHFKKDKRQNTTYMLSGLIIIPTIIWSSMFFSIYLKSDVRLQATKWINKNIPKNSYILTETGNTLEVPLKGVYKKLAFDFYNLETSLSLQNQLIDSLTQADYFIIQSRRIFLNHQRLPKMFPITSSFYDQLFSGQLGFEKIKEFHSYPQLVMSRKSLVIRDEVAEETWSVFDHPVIRIYKKTKLLTKQDYEELLKI